MLDQCDAFKRAGQVCRINFFEGWFAFIVFIVEFATNIIINFVNTDLFLRKSNKSIDIPLNYDMIKA